MNRSIVRSAKAGTARLTGSDTATAPAAIVTEGLPPKVRTRSDFGSIAASLARSATCAAPTASGALPNALLSTARTRSPPSDTWTICRSVWFEKFRGAGGVGGGPPPCRPGGGPNVGGAHGDPGGTGARAGGPCGRATTAVAQVATNRSSLRPPCAAQRRVETRSREAENKARDRQPGKPPVSEMDVHVCPASHEPRRHGLFLGLANS